MSNELRKQIHDNLNLKETDELLSIWKTNDRIEWSETAFDVLEEILRERIGQIPPPNEPVLEHVIVEEKDDETDELEEWEAKLLDDENQPEFYDTLDVISLRSNINKVAVAVIIINILVGLWSFPAVKTLIETGHFMQLFDMATYVPSMLITILGVGLQITITYFSLKTLAHILRILMEMEFNSRKTK